MKQARQLADFTVRIIIVFVTIVALLYFAKIYNSLVFSIVLLIFLISLLMKGVGDIFSKD